MIASLRPFNLQDENINVSFGYFFAKIQNFGKNFKCFEVTFFPPVYKAIKIPVFS